MFKSRGHSKYTTTCLSHLACSSAKGGLTLYHPIAPLGGPSIFGDTRNWELSSFTLEAIEIGLTKKLFVHFLGGIWGEVWVHLGVNSWSISVNCEFFCSTWNKSLQEKPFFEKGPAFHHEEPVRSLHGFAIGNTVDVLGSLGIFISEHPWISLVKNILRRPRGVPAFFVGHPHLSPFSPLINLATWRILVPNLVFWTNELPSMMDYVDSELNYVCIEKTCVVGLRKKASKTCVCVDSFQYLLLLYCLLK